MKIRLSITTWLLFLVLLSLLPLLIYSVYTSYRFTEERRVAIESELIRRSDALSFEVRDRLSNTLGYVQSLAISNAAITGDIEGLYRFARRIQEINPDIAAFTLIDPNNQMVFMSLRPLGEAFPVSVIPAVRKVFATGKPVLSAPFKSPIRDKTVVALGIPLVRDGKVAYCLRAILATDVLNDLLQPSHLPNGWIASLVDADGILVARSHSPERFVGQMAPPQLVEALHNKTFGIWDGITKEGIKTRSILRPIGDWEWFLSLGVPTDTLHSPLDREVVSIAVTGSVLLLLGIGAALFISRRITIALRQTVDATKAVLTGAPPRKKSSGIAELDQMRDTLTEVDDYSHLLEQQVTARTRELLDANERIASFATQLEDSVEAERQRISREVHDQIGAVLTGIKMIFRGLPQGTLPEAHEKGVFEALDMGVATARRIAAELRPPLIDDLGLQAAVEQLLETTLRPAQVLYSVDLDGCASLTPRQTLGAYRIIQEASTNVLRHSGAAHFAVKGMLSDEGSYEISITDDGVGMPSTDSHQGSLGMTGMYERAELMGGKLVCTGTPHHGVRLTLNLPVIAEKVSP